MSQWILFVLLLVAAAFVVLKIVIAARGASDEGEDSYDEDDDGVIQESVSDETIAEWLKIVGNQERSIEQRESALRCLGRIKGPRAVGALKTLILQMPQVPEELVKIFTNEHRLSVIGPFKQLGGQIKTEEELQECLEWCLNREPKIALAGRSVMYGVTGSLRKRVSVLLLQRVEFIVEALGLDAIELLIGPEPPRFVQVSKFPPNFWQMKIEPFRKQIEALLLSNEPNKQIVALTLLCFGETESVAVRVRELVASSDRQVRRVAVLALIASAGKLELVSLELKRRPSALSSST